MEVNHQENMKNNTNNSNVGGCRWNPTKEQIDMLEDLYRQGLRTPSAEQIQHITNRLSAFGHIEGKNVFYWFQNHKARQRQKQKHKQETLAFYHCQSFLHPPPFPPFHHNVVCSPYYMPTVQKDLGLYQQPYPNVPLSAEAFKKTKVPESINERNKQALMQRYNKVMQDQSNSRNYSELNMMNVSSKNHQQETLDLFPMYPTGILEARHGNYDNSNNQNSSSENESCSFGRDDEKSSENNLDHPFFDFFGGRLN